jgi:DNA-binding NarL/FixJ family response regulator
LAVRREVKLAHRFYTHMTIGQQIAGTKGKTGMVNVLLVDDHPLVRDQLRMALESEADLKVCGEAEDSHHALSVIRATKPGLAIVDLTLKGCQGLDLIKEIHLRYPKILVMVVSMHDESLYAERAIHAGARGYITKQEATKKILQAIRHVLSGEIYLSDKMAAKILSKMAKGREVHGRSSIERLADRELQVFKMIGHGRSTQQIADELHLDMKTIETYRSRIKSKLGIEDATELLQQAILWAHSGDSA